MTKIEQIKKELAKKGFNIKTASEVVKDKKIRTGIFGFDWVTDGGISMSEGGHRFEFFGPESSGKTTFALYIIKKYQELNKSCMFIDGECSYDRDWGEKIGIDNDKLLISYPDSLEQMGNILVEAIPQMDLIVIDSIVSMIPIGEADRDTEEAQMALSSRINSLITRKLYHAVGTRATTFIFINQMRDKVGVVYGNPHTTGGGRALKHMYQTRIEFKPGKAIEVDDEKIGLALKLNCVKNKRGKPYRVAELDFYTNGTIDNKKSLFYAGLKFGIIERNGNTYAFGEHKEVGQEKFYESLDENTLKNIEEEIWKKII